MTSTLEIFENSTATQPHDIEVLRWVKLANDIESATGIEPSVKKYRSRHRDRRRRTFVMPKWVPRLAAATPGMALALLAVPTVNVNPALALFAMFVAGAEIALVAML